MAAHVSMPLHLNDGTRVYLRPLRSTDREQYVEELRRLSPKSRYERFLTAFDNVTEDMTERLVDDVDGVYHVAVVLLTDTDDDPVALGRFIRDRADPSYAEVAFGVVDDRHGQGAGGLVTQSLKALALDRGVRYFTATVLSSNSASLHLLSGLGRVVSTERVGSGVVEVVVDLHGRPHSGPAADDGTDAEAWADSIEPTQELPLARPRRSPRGTRT